MEGRGEDSWFSPHLWFWVLVSGEFTQLIAHVCESSSGLWWSQYSTLLCHWFPSVNSHTYKCFTQGFCVGGKPRTRRSRMRETIDLILRTLLLRTPSWPTWAPDSVCISGISFSLSTPCFLSVIKGNPLTFYVEQLISCSALVFQFCSFFTDLVLEALWFHSQMV